MIINIDPHVQVLDLTGELRTPLFILQHIGGLLSSWALSKPIERTFRDWIKERYNAQPSDKMTRLFEKVGDNLRLESIEFEEDERDPPLDPVIVFQDGEEIFAIYVHGIVLFRDSTGPDEIMRMD
jgi:hypothetical protein